MALAATNGLNHLHARNISPEIVADIHDEDNIEEENDCAPLGDSSEDLDDIQSESEHAIEPDHTESDHSELDHSESEIEDLSLSDDDFPTLRAIKDDLHDYLGPEDEENAWLLRKCIHLFVRNRLDLIFQQEMIYSPTLIVTTYVLSNSRLLAICLALCSIGCGIHFHIR